MTQNPDTERQAEPARPPSAATRARRDAKLALAPFVANLTAWHQQSARLFLELSRAEQRQEHRQDLLMELDLLLAEVRQRRDAMAEKAAALTVTTRVDDLHRSFRRLIEELEASLSRCQRLGTRRPATTPRLT